MTHASIVSRRPQDTSRRPLKHVGLALTLAAGLALSACHKNNVQGLTGGDIETAVDTLKAAPEHGFAADQFQLARIEEMLKSSDKGQQAQGARELRGELVEYARAQHGLTIPRSAFPQEWALKPASYDAEADLNQALTQHRLKDWLAAQPTPIPEYQTLQKVYVAYLKAAASGGWPVIQAFPLRAGLADPKVVLLRQRLAFEDPLLLGQPVDGPVDAGLVAAVQRYQEAHGLRASGQLDAATLKELNVPALSRAAQIRANLERLRWLPRQEPATRVDVNIAAATMDYYADGKLMVHMLSASGRPGGDETPMLTSNIDSIVLNPPWNVPQQIATEEIIPKGDAYLQEKGFVMDGDRLVQKPGPDAALGLVKFEFDNPFAVYLHDTPAKAAFNSTQRAVSHGCVRLAQAVGFAKLLLSQQPGWSADRVDQVLASGETTHVKLAKSTPVRLNYLTAFIENNRISFRQDVYGWDAKLLTMLDNPPPPKKAGKKA